ncbi:MAG: monothiol glutaredoxin, Grx4 family, partial [Deltaproteobacteria bacterium]|nr:monothiol glutaredoxin, Grx4 family [Deltaproteobacteria bacterium]
TVVSILNEYLPAYATVNVLTEPEIREGIKTYSDWPTIPQLYVRGEFIGGCDIVKEMHANGELSEKLGVKLAQVEPPAVRITESALVALKDALSEAAEGECLRIAVGPRFEHDLTIGPKEKGDVVVTASGIEVAFDRASARKANGLVVDFVDGPEGAGFKLENPNRPKG